jgi:hypothetical protein
MDGDSIVALQIKGEWLQAEFHADVMKTAGMNL